MKKLLLALLLTCSISYADTELVSVRIDDFSKGQNSYDLSDIIQPNQGITLENVVCSKKGQLSKRGGQAIFAQDLSDTAFVGIGRYDPDTSTSYLITASGGLVQYSAVSPASWVTINPDSASSLSVGYNTEFIQANNLLFVLNGQDPTSWWDYTKWWIGTTDSGSPPVATTGSWLRNYLFLAGNSTHPDWVYFSNNLDPKLFTSTDVFRVNTGDGQEIIRLEPFKLNELIIYKIRSIYILDITGTTPLTDWTLQPVSKAIGCIAPRSVVNLGNDHWFLSGEPYAIRSLSRTSYDKLLVEMVSQPIQDIFDGTGDTIINESSIEKATAILFDNKYILAIPTGSSNVNNYVVSYDFISKSWTCINGWYPAAWQVYNDSLYYIDALDGRVIQCFTGTVGDVASGPVVTSASEPTVAIQYTYISKNLTFDAPNNYKAPDAIDVEFEPTGSYEADIYISLDNGDWQYVDGISLAGSAPVLPITLPFTLGTDGLARATFPLQRFGEFKKIKVKVIQDGLSERCNLYSFEIYGKIKPWRRE